MPDTVTTPEVAKVGAGTETDLGSQLIQSMDALSKGELTEASSGLLMKVILPAGTALVLLIVTYFAAKLVSRWVSTAVCARIDKTLGKFAGKLTFYTVVLIAGLAILQTAGIGITSFAAIMAAAGFAVGLAFQGTLSNFASGVLLLVFRPFKVGDVVNAAGILGKVNEIDLFTTTFDTPDNRRMIIPNSSIASATIENISYHPHRRVDVTVGVEYAASLDETRAVLTRCAEMHSEKMITGEGRGSQILLSNLGASSVDWTLRFWTASKDFFAVKEALTVEVKKQLDASGIGIPFPQMQLHVSGTKEPSFQGADGEHALPIPKMNVAAENRSSKTRPRARGNTNI